jgi:U2-associated protein SR140
MSDSAKITEFPAIKSKLAAPTKKSIFERQKAEAEAKRRREEAETAAVYEDFVKSFEDDDGGSSASRARNSAGGVGFGSSTVAGSGPKRHFTVPTGPAAGRGGVGHAGRGGFGHDAVTGPPSRKRIHDGFHSRSRDSDQGLFAFEDSLSGPTTAATAFQNSDDEDNAADGRTAEHVTPKPTLHLSSLPPGTSPAVIKSLLPPNLKVDAVRLIPPSGPSSTERRSLSAIVTLAKDTPANDIDAAVGALQNRYLGWGYYLSLARHLSSAALSAAPPISGGSGSALASMPFGAKPLPTGPGGSLSRAPPPHRGGFAPPASYTPTGPGQFGRAPGLQVSVNPPSDLRQLRLIHKTIENLLSHGPEFEALLMSRPEVQREQKWAWIWDARSPGGVWYRWRLWEILSGSQEGSGYGRNASNGMPQYVFDGGASWVAPKKGLRFEYITRLEEFVSDDDYDSSEDENSDDEDAKRHHYHNRYGGPQDSDVGAPDGDGKAYLNPLQRSKLAHLLARLPTSTAKLRKGDVARVTCFAIEHAGEGADEVVDMIVLNIEQPFTHTSANPDRRANEENEEEEEGEGAKDRPKEKEDTSASKLIALYLVSDILSSSSTSGVRHAWRYRQLFETALRNRHIFEGLGRLDKDLHWGRLRAEKWKRSVQSILTLWEGWCVFPQASQEHFAAVFISPPPTAAEKAAAAAAASHQSLPGTSSSLKSRWKTVDATPTSQTTNGSRTDINVTPATDNQATADEDVDDVDGEPMLSGEDEDIDGMPMEDEDEDEDDGSNDIDGEPMKEDTEEVAETIEPTSEPKSKPEPPPPEQTTAPSSDFRLKGAGLIKLSSDSTPMLGKRRRPKAEDMFADSDDDQ